jgi:serine/threonine-protein kinase
MGKYRIIRRLAEGGMGEIFIGRSEGRAGFEKIVVLKRILQQNVPTATPSACSWTRPG